MAALLGASVSQFCDWGKTRYLMDMAVLPFAPTPFFGNKNRAFWQLQAAGWGGLIPRGRFMRDNSLAFSNGKQL